MNARIWFALVFLLLAVAVALVSESYWEAYQRADRWAVDGGYAPRDELIRLNEQ